MVKTHSNLGTEQFLDVIITESGPPGETWYISITSSGFPHSKMINVIQSKDQQLVDIEKVIREFISREDEEQKLELAKYLEKMAKMVRSSI